MLPRGAFSLYVPERCDGKTPLPLVVALHGGFGHGHDFVWTWLREARSRPFLLLAPSSRGTTWSLDAPAHRRCACCTRWSSPSARAGPSTASRILLTGLSDGATFTLLAGLAPDSPFSHLAPVSGVLHPANFANGNLERARGRRVRLCHGALDWLFPVSLARLARDELVRAGAEIEYREIADLSHAYPREENDGDPALARRALTGLEGQGPPASFVTSLAFGSLRAPPQAALAAIRSGDRRPAGGLLRRTDSPIRLTIPRCRTLVASYAQRALRSKAERIARAKKICVAGNDVSAQRANEGGRQRAARHFVDGAFERHVEALAHA